MASVASRMRHTKLRVQVRVAGMQDFMHQYFPALPHFDLDTRLSGRKSPSESREYRMLYWLPG